MKRKNYVFPDCERSRLEIGLTIDLFHIVCITPVFGIIHYDYHTSPYHKPILLAFGIIYFAFLLFPLLYGLKDRKYRFARYEIQDDFVCIRFGKTKRIIKVTDDVHIAQKVMRFGEKAAEIEHVFWVLWKEGVEVPPDINRPYHALKKYNIVILPDNEEVSQKIYALFGERGVLRGETSKNANTYYVFSDYERSTFKVGMGLMPMISTFFLSMFFIICMKHRNWPDFLILNIVVGGMMILCLWSLLIGVRYKKYRFARYRLSENAVVMNIGEEERIITRSDSFHISLRTMAFTERYENLMLKYIVLWKISEPQPKDEISPYYSMKRSKIIVLPDEENVRNQLQTSLGVKTIGYWRTSSPH